MARPYQPSLLRLLHGLTALLVFAAWISGSLILLRFDHAQGEFSLPGLPELTEHHQVIGLVLLPFALMFGLYALIAGRAALRKAANLLPLLVLVLALASGLLMDDDGRFSADLHHLVKTIHVFAWAALAVSLLVHTLAALRRGGLPLIRSMVSAPLQAYDWPTQWPAQLVRSLKRHRR